MAVPIWLSGYWRWLLPEGPDFHFKEIKEKGKKIHLLYEGLDGKDLVRTIDRQRYPE